MLPLIFVIFVIRSRLSRLSTVENDVSTLPVRRVALEALRLACDTLTDTVNAADSVLLELQSEIRRDYNVTARITPAESALPWFLQDVIERAETAGYLPKPAGIKTPPGTFNRDTFVTTSQKAPGYFCNPVAPA